MLYDHLFSVEEHQGVSQGVSGAAAARLAVPPRPSFHFESAKHPQAKSTDLLYAVVKGNCKLLMKRGFWWNTGWKWKAHLVAHQWTNSMHNGLRVAESYRRSKVRGRDRVCDLWGGDILQLHFFAVGWQSLITKNRTNNFHFCVWNIHWISLLRT